MSGLSRVHVCGDKMYDGGWTESQGSLLIDSFVDTTLQRAASLRIYFQSTR